jgi:hypothetical protein
MTLALTCDTDEVVSNTSLNWLEAKKAEKARCVKVPANRELLSKELDAFIAEPYAAEDCNPLGWWNGHRLKYPSVAAVARVYLGIPATSVASERVFSKCGRVCSERRSLLTPQHIEQLVFLAHNLPL